MSVSLELQDDPLQYEVALMPYSDGVEEGEINYGT